MAKTADDFINTYNGKVDDFDGVLKAQCVDAYKRFCWWLGVPVLATKTGWADGYWYHRVDYSKHVTYITNTKKLKKGDWLFWAKGSSCPSSHVAMFVKYAENGYAYCFGQNQGGNGGYCTVKLKLDILGAFRFKALEEEKPEWKQDDTGWWYRYPDGSYPKNEWKFIDNEWYFFNEKGYMQTGWIQTKGVWYYCNEKGKMLKSTWLEYNGQWYFLGKNGAMFIGKHSVPVMFDKEGKFIGNWR
jgi:hypothetical protein